MPNDQISVLLQPPNGATGWLMKVGNGGWTSGPQYAPIVVPSQHKADITFTIQNGTGQHASFASNPILLPAKDKVFDNPVINSATSFTITDKNPDVDHSIPYVLLFTNAPKLDPIIDNDGGGRISSDLSTYNTSFVAIGGFAVGVIVTLIMRSMFRKRAG